MYRQEESACGVKFVFIVACRGIRIVVVSCWLLDFALRRKFPLLFLILYTSFMSAFFSYCYVAPIIFSTLISRHPFSFLPFQATQLSSSSISPFLSYPVFFTRLDMLLMPYLTQPATAPSSPPSPPHSCFLKAWKAPKCPWINKPAQNPTGQKGWQNIQGIYEANKSHNILPSAGLGCILSFIYPPSI